MDRGSHYDDYGDNEEAPTGAHDVAGAAHCVVGYVPSGKAKARLLCAAFVQSIGGAVRQPPPRRLDPGAAAFFGVTMATQHLWLQARTEDRDWYYLDNAYFDAVRGRLFRATKNAVQSSGREPPDWARWAALGVPIQAWRTQGRHVLLVVQSDSYMRVVAGYQGCWWRDALALLGQHTDREIVINAWRGDKLALAGRLKKALRDCWAVVTWSSAAANEALLAGVPVFAAGPCAAAAMGLADLRRIESPVYPDGRARWAAALAGRQWTLDELRDGTAWRTLNGLGG